MSDRRWNLPFAPVDRMCHDRGVHDSIYAVAEFLDVSPPMMVWHWRRYGLNRWNGTPQRIAARLGVYPSDVWGRDVWNDLEPIAFAYRHWPQDWPFNPSR